MNYTLPEDIQLSVDSFLKTCAEEISSLINAPVKVHYYINHNEITEGMIRTMICEAFDLPWDMITSIDRRKPVAAARQSYCYLCRAFTSLTYKVIGQNINRDHTTAISSRDTAIRYLFIRDDFIMASLAPLKLRLENILKKQDHE